MSRAPSRRALLAGAAALPLANLPALAGADPTAAAADARLVELVAMVHRIAAPLDQLWEQFETLSAHAYSLYPPPPDTLSFRHEFPPGMNLNCGPLLHSDAYGVRRYGCQEVQMLRDTRQALGWHSDGPEQDAYDRHWTAKLQARADEIVAAFDRWQGHKRAINDACGLTVLTDKLEELQIEQDRLVSQALALPSHSLGDLLGKAAILKGAFGVFDIARELEKELGDAEDRDHPSGMAFALGIVRDVLHLAVANRPASPA